MIALAYSSILNAIFTMTINLLYIDLETTEGSYINLLMSTIILLFFAFLHYLLYELLKFDWAIL